MAHLVASDARRGMGLVMFGQLREGYTRVSQCGRIVGTGLRCIAALREGLCYLAVVQLFL